MTISSETNCFGICRWLPFFTKWYKNELTAYFSQNGIEMNSQYFILYCVLLIFVYCLDFFFQNWLFHSLVPSSLWVKPSVTWQFVKSFIAIWGWNSCQFSVSGILVWGWMVIFSFAWSNCRLILDAKLLLHPRVNSFHHIMLLLPL